MSATPTSMRALWITKHGGPETLAVRESPDPTPVEGQVRVRAKACGLNFAEVSARQGLYPDAPKPPCIVGYEGAGVIDAVGPGVDASRIGERVLYMIKFGAHSDTVIVPAAQAVTMPDKMSFEEAAAIPVCYITAYHMLFRIANIKPGMHVLIHMAAGGVGTAALQLCATVPNITTYGTASASKHDYLRGLGCTHPIDYRTKDYAEEIKTITKGRGVDVVLDPMGGPEWKKAYEMLRPAGMLVGFGFSNAISGSTRNMFRVVKQFLQIPKYSPLQLMDTNRAVAGVNLGHLWDEQEMLLGQLRDILRLWEEGKVKPHIDKVYTFAEAAEAHRRIEERKNTGKIVLVP